MTNVYFDCEFTGLHKKTTLISIGLVSDCGKRFYAEFNDYDKTQINDWLRDNVLSNLIYPKNTHLLMDMNKNNIEYMYSDSNKIGTGLNVWFSQFNEVTLVSDCLAYDYVLLVDLITHCGESIDLPKNINYIPVDICGMMQMLDIDPDTSRESFVDGRTDSSMKHNALYDAEVIKLCYEKLMYLEWVIK